MSPAVENQEQQTMVQDERQFMPVPLTGEMQDVALNLGPNADMEEGEVFQRKQDERFVVIMCEMRWTLATPLT